MKKTNKKELKHKSSAPLYLATQEITEYLDALSWNFSHKWQSSPHLQILQDASHNQFDNKQEVLFLPIPFECIHSQDWSLCP